MSQIPQVASTQGSPSFDPDAFFDAWAQETLTPPYDNDFRKFIIKAFGLRGDDSFVYRAVAEVTLLQAQTYLEFGGQGGLHGWYRDGEGKEIPAPPAVDIAAYNDLFRPTTNTTKALKALSANAKKDTIRAAVAAHLTSLYQPPASITIPKSKSHVNPYFDILAWSNQALEWAGPEASTHKIKISHALLPVLYHHFSCVCPSFEALEIIRVVAKGRGVVDVGSGNGYWTYMLRRMKQDGKGAKNLEVVPVDNGLSDWRTLWVADTVEIDGAEWLRKNDGGKGHMLLMVYPQVSHDFTAKTIKAYHGSTIVVAGTQNANGYTAFADELLVDWFARVMPGWEKVCQIPLPSFAGKDEALFVYEKKAA